MHEYSIIQALLSRIEAEAGRRGPARSHRVRISIGELSGVEIELLATAYGIFRERTICENAPLEICRSRRAGHARGATRDIASGERFSVPATAVCRPG